MCKLWNLATLCSHFQFGADGNGVKDNGNFFRVVINKPPRTKVCAFELKKGSTDADGVEMFQLHLRAPSITRAESQRSFPGKRARNVITRESNPVIRREQDSVDSFLLVEQSRRLSGVGKRPAFIATTSGVLEPGHQVQHVLKWNCDSKKRTRKFFTIPQNDSLKKSRGK